MGKDESAMQHIGEASLLNLYSVQFPSPLSTALFTWVQQYCEHVELSTWRLHDDVTYYISYSDGIRSTGFTLNACENRSVLLIPVFTKVLLAGAGPVKDELSDYTVSNCTVIRYNL